jgi:hypothetical protein
MRPLFHDDELEARFWDRGYVVVDLLDGEAVTGLLATFGRFAEHHWEGISPTILSLDLPYRAAVHADVRAVMEAPLAAYLDAFGLCHAGFVPKSAASPISAMELHQDHAWVDESVHQGLTVWCPLVDTGAHNGWLGVVEGSHRVGPHERAALPFAWPHLAEEIHERHMSYLAMRAGQAMLMHPALFHASPPNSSQEPRVVAAGMAAPLEAPLLYFHADFGGDTRKVDVYEVDGDFYQRHVLGNRPDGSPAHSLHREPPALALADLDRLTPAARA